MNEDINQHGVRSLYTSVASSYGMLHIGAFISHELTPERERELTDAIETIIVLMVKTWVSR